MPIYIYECKNCGRFEKNQKITEDALKICPKCQGKIRRVITSPGLVFKGDGWSRSKSYERGKRNE